MASATDEQLRGAELGLLERFPWRRIILVVIFDERSSLGLVRLRVKKASQDLNGVFDSIMQKVEAEKAHSGANFESPFAEITDEDIDSLFSE